jgi:hypothetical protein
MAGILGGVAAISDIRFEDQKFVNVEGMVVALQLCHGLRGGAGLEDPRNRG